MEMKFAQVVNKGMQRDYSMNTASQEFAYENKNIRITTTGNESFLAVTNEKSTICNSILMTHLQAYEVITDYKYDTDDTYVEELTLTFNFYDGAQEKEEPLKKDTTFRIYDNYEGSKEYEEIVIPKGVTTFTITDWDIQNLHFDKGVKVIQIDNKELYNIADDPFVNMGTILGVTTIGEYIIVFSKYEDSSEDVIYRLKESDDGVWLAETVFRGNLSFDINYPIECITSYESKDVQKVYWVDGVNQPRMINIMKLNQTSLDTDVNFIPNIGDILPSVKIEKQYEGTGLFPAGVIQYYITYYKKFGQETNAIYTSPLYNISPENRGGKEDETQTCSFKITIADVNDNFDYIRVYSLIRTTENAEPTVSIVNDLNIYKDKPNYKYQLIDDNINNINVPSSDILFLGGNTISAFTIEQKDNTLFLGNISSIVNNDDYTELKKELNNNRDNNNDGLTFISRPIKEKESHNVDYGYSPNMDLSSKDRGFKYLEWYRFGLQFQSETGEWSNTLWINDKQNHLRPNIVEYDENTDKIIHDMYESMNDYHSLAAIKYTPSNKIKNLIKDYNSKNYRLVMAEHNDSTRTIKTQGVVLPTLFNLKQRSTQTCYASPLWSLACLTDKEHYQNIDGNNFSYFTDASDYFFRITPFQQLDTTLYDIHPDYPDYIVENPEDYTLSFKFLPSAASNTVDKDLDKSKDWYLSKIDVKIRIFYAKPGELTVHDATNNFDSPHGNYVVQNVFMVSITPIIKNYHDGTLKRIKVFNLIEYRLSGKVKKTIEYILNLAGGITWNQYYEDTKEDRIFDFGDHQDLVLHRAELPSSEEVYDGFKVKLPNYSEAYRDSFAAQRGYRYYNHIPLYRNGVITKTDALINNNSNQYFIDANTCNMWSPNINNISDNNLKFRIVGVNNILNTISDYNIIVNNNTVGTKVYEQYENSFNRYNYNKKYPGISSFPLWPNTQGTGLYTVYMWNQGSIAKDDESTPPYDFKLKDKTFANFWKLDTNYVDNTEIKEYGNITFKKFNENTVYINGELYQGNYQNVLFPKHGRRALLYDKNGLTLTSPFEQINGLIQENYFTLRDDNTTLNVNDSVNIKYSSSQHLVFNLGTKHFVNVLPSYQITSDYTGTNDIISRTSYPVKLQLINYIIDDLDNNDVFKSTIVNNKDSDDLKIQYRLDSSRDGKSIYVERINDIELDRCYLSFNKIYGLKDIVDFFREGEEYLCYNKILTVENYTIIYQDQELGDEATIYEANIKTFDVTDTMVITPDETVLEIVNSTEKIVIESENTSITGEKYKEDNILNNNKIYVGEFYLDYDPNIFMGGNNENALELNTFIPISDPTPIGETIYGFEGDTYYQQWDCLRIYPTSEEDANKVVDIISLPLESHINLDGDTRITRGRQDVINVRPSNMIDQINTVYSQSNNYVTSKILDEKSEKSKHPLQYWWSLSKSNMSDIDNWTSVNLTSVAELDGDKGPLNKIKRWNNQLYAFQDKAIAMINFNNQTTIATQEGVPVEIANSGKVNGHYYITTNNGCKNKCSIVESPNGLYFIDSYNKSINVIGDGIKSLSQLNLFQDWIEQKERGNIWTPIRDTQAFKGFYDPIHKEVYFADGEDCICYNELLQQFTSFYDYQNMNYMFTLDNHIYSIPTDGNLYTMFEGGDYCNLFGKQCDYYMQYKINNEPFIDKTWTNLEYRADVFEWGNIHNNEFVTDNILSNETFDSLKVWNEYQNGELDLTKVRFNYLKDAKLKFRIWRTNLPRAKSTRSNKFGLDRIRNPWIMLELKKTGDTSKRMEFHDLIIKYVI